MRASNVPNAVISTLGLGSCLGITAYDPQLGIGGLLHAMLPDSKRHGVAKPPVAMYLDVAVPAFTESLVKLGADMHRLEFKIFGGAQILQSNEYFSIGRQNVEMMKQLVARHQLRVKTWEIGGQTNRSIELYTGNGRVLLRMPSRPEVWV